MDSGDRPALFLGSEPDSAQIGYVSEHTPLQVVGRVRDGRVPVRIDGGLRTRGFVNARMLALRVQRRGRLRGTPLYVGPDDVVSVIGRNGQRLQVRAQARFRGQPFGASYDGSYPLAGLAAHAAPEDAQRADPGTPYTVPANTPVPLSDAPGAGIVGELPAQAEPYPVQVINQSEGWLAVRAGDGPYLIGWTSVALLPASAAASASSVASVTAPLAQPIVLPPASNDDAAIAVNGMPLPARLANEPGALKRVAAGTKIVFGDSVIGVLKREGYARVVQAYDEAGYADVFVAADDDVALRGLVRSVDLSDPAQAAGVQPGSALSAPALTASNGAASSLAGDRDMR